MTERIEQNIFKGLDTIKSAETLLGRVINFPDYSTNNKRVRGRILELEIFHPAGEETDKIENSNIRSHFDDRLDGDIVSAYMQGGRFLAIKTPGKRSCVRINSVFEVASKATELTEVLNIDKDVSEEISGTNIFSGSRIFLENNINEIDNTVKELEHIADKINNELIRKIILKGISINYS